MSDDRETPVRKDSADLRLQSAVSGNAVKPPEVATIKSKSRKDRC
jgi:hypothetical protein